jgi:hypothetical protein
MNQVTIGEFNYQVGKLPAMTQFHIVRRIGPVLASLGVSVLELAKSGKGLEEDSLLLASMGTASEVLAKMSNEDAEFVIFSCLAVVKRQQNERWQQVVTGKAFQFQDLDMQAMLRLTVEVLKENLSSFFPPLLAGSSTPTA